MGERHSHVISAVVLMLPRMLGNIASLLTGTLTSPNQLTYNHTQVSGDNGVFPYVKLPPLDNGVLCGHVDLKGVPISHPLGSLYALPVLLV